MFDDMKRNARPDFSAAEAARLGEELREARQALGWSVEDASAQLRIRRVYLAALEEGRVRDLPSAAYAIGFVRNYSAFLGLDSDDMVRRFREAVQSAGGRKTDLVFPEPVPERGFPAGVVVVAGLAVAVAAYVGWYNWTGSRERVVDAVPPVPPRLETAARDGEALRPATPVVPPPGTPPGAAPGAAPAAQPQVTLPVPVPVPVTVPPPAPTPTAPAAAPAQAENRLVIRARGDAWTQVRDVRSGQQLLNRTMRTGETFTVPVRDGLLLSTGAAQNIEILLDGQPAPALQGASGVRRDVSLDLERLRPRPAAPAGG
ncbi:MAG: DUF4115 domain-containing protein, partial [Acetobacteraceae bacterium]|nr:DUF4115 domain-containing protein [Acetobacteraceae bacterium]